MSENLREKLGFTSAKGRVIEAAFDGGAVSSDGGLLLVREVERKLGLIHEVARRLSDERQRGKVRHDVETMLRQRVMGLVAGWEDLNDAETLRHDPVHQIAAGEDQALASAPTLCRFENRQSRAAAWAVNVALVEQFIASHRKAPPVLVLDFDATDAPVHGKQEGRFFHGYYDCHCFLPLYVFCGDQLLVAYLRRSNIDAAKHAAAILKLLVTRLRRAWPRTKIVFRADSGFCRDRLLSWCDRHEVKYVVGIARNDRLVGEVAPVMQVAQQRYEQTAQKQRLFTAFDYAAGSWRRIRWVIAKAEHSQKGSNPRFIVTNIVGDAQKIYDQRYCQRGEMENRVKEQRMLFADRVSAHRWWANQWRLCLSAIAYTLMEALRRLALQGTELAQATCATLRSKLIKVGAVVVEKATIVRLHLSSHHPLQDLFLAARQGRFWSDEATADNTSGAVVETLKVHAATGSGTSSLVRSETKTVIVPPFQQTFTYDNDGNLTSDGIWRYTWDAENRLTSMTTLDVAGAFVLPTAQVRKLTFLYGYSSRRVQKRVYGWTGSSWQHVTQWRFLYDGWNLVAELKTTGEGSVGTLLRTYTWGLDIVGSRTESGGVGALIQIHDHEVNKTLFPTYDGNGNVAALLNASTGAIEAAYEYSPFGELLRAEGSYAQSNPFRFSTKYTDVETGLVYYGERFYDPVLGRFVGRDPIDELGGLNLYGFLANGPVSAVDYLGMGELETPGNGYGRWGIGNRGWGYYNDPADTYRQLMGVEWYEQLVGFDWYDSQHTGSVDVPVAAVQSPPPKDSAPQPSTPLPSPNEGGVNSRPSPQGVAIAPNSAGAASGGSALGNLLGKIPLIGPMLQPLGNIVSGVGNTALGIVSFGQSGTFGRGIGQIGSGIGNTVNILATDLAAGVMGLAGTAYTTVRDVANVVSLGNVYSGGNPIKAVGNLVWDALVPDYGRWNGPNWPPPNSSWAPMNKQDRAGFNHDRDYNHLQWVRDSLSPNTPGTATGPIGIAYALLGVVPFTAAGVAQNYGIGPQPTGP